MNLQSIIKAAFYRCGYSVKRLRPARTLRGVAANGSSDVMALLHHVNP